MRLVLKHDENKEHFAKVQNSMIIFVGCISKLMLFLIEIRIEFMIFGAKVGEFAKVLIFIFFVILIKLLGWFAKKSKSGETFEKWRNIQNVV